MPPSSAVNRYGFHLKWPTTQTALLVLWIVLSLTGSTEFKTSKGTCFLSAWNNTLYTSSTVNETVSLSEMYQYQLEQGTEEGNSIVMLTSCLADGRFRFSSNIVSTSPVGERLYARQAQFRVQLNVTLSDIDEEFSLLESPSVTFWFRVLACNLHEIGFCHPFIDRQAWNQQLIPMTADLSQKHPIRSYQDTNSVISSQWIELPLLNFSRGDTPLRLETMSTLNMIMPDFSGEYDFVGHATFHVVSNERYYRADVATSLVDNSVDAVMSEADAPEVLAVGRAAKVAVGVIIGVGCTVILLCFGIIVYFRKHRVMTLAQAGLLAWLTGCCFFTVLLSFLVLPTRDSFCRYSSLALIPASMAVNIMIGRLFRVYSTLGTAHRLGKGALSTSAKPGLAPTLMRRQSRKAEDLMMTVLGHFAFSRCFATSQNRMRSSSLRRATTQNDSIRLILVLSAPQIILSVTRTCLYDSGLIFEYDEANMTMRQVCDGDGLRWYRYTGLTLILLQYIICLFIAWCSRDLPAAFNETTQIFKAAFWGAFVSLGLVLFQFFIDLPSTSPGISSIVHVTATLLLELLMIIYIVIPKIRWVLSGKKVVVSNLLRQMPPSPDFGHLRGEPPSAENHSGHEDANAGTGIQNHMEVSKFIIKTDDPLPMEVESEMYQLSEVIGSLQEKGMSGHAINADELRTLKAVAFSLATKVERVEFEDQSAADVTDFVPSALVQESDDVAILEEQEMEGKLQT